MSGFGNYAKHLDPLSVLLCATILTVAASAQDLPSKIRGYSVHKERITISTSAADDTQAQAPAAVEVGDPAVSEFSLSGVTFELPLSFTSPSQSGKVDFLTFHDFSVNGIPVSLEEYVAPFEFRKNAPITLPKPVPVFLNTARLLQAAWKELRESKDEWTVTGRVFIFGRFRRFGFYHKRVVPVDVRVSIKNPVRTKTE